MLWFDMILNNYDKRQYVNPWFRKVYSSENDIDVDTIKEKCLLWNFEKRFLTRKIPMLDELCIRT